MNLLGHGEIEIEEHKDIVIVRFIGCINMDTYLVYSNRILDISKQFNGKKWAEIHDYRRWELSTSDIYTESKKAEKNPVKQQNRCSDFVVIVDNVFIKKVSEMQSEDELFLTPEYVKSELEAFEYLKSLGYLGNL